MKQSSRKKTSVANAAKISSAVTQKATGRHTGSPGVSPLLERIVSILDGAHPRVVRSVNSEMVLTYRHIGREIVEHHQGGAVRAEYGGHILDVLSTKLQEGVGRGYLVTSLRYFRLFYRTYAKGEPRIRYKSRDDLSPPPRNIPTMNPHHERLRAGQAATSRATKDIESGSTEKSNANAPRNPAGARKHL
jgi:hypothetical protein